MLGPIYPGFLKTGFYKYAKSNNLPVEPLKSFAYVEILRLDMAQLSALPKSQKRILGQQRGSPGNREKKYNWSQIPRLTQPRYSIRQN